MTENDSGTIELTRRKALGSMAVLGVAGAGAGAGTWGYFYDQEMSESNTVSAGTLNLNDPADEQFAFEVNPGQSASGTVSIEEESDNIDADHMIISVDLSDQSPNDYADELDATLEYSGEIISEEEDTLADLDGDSFQVDPPGLNDGENVTLTVEWSVSDGVDTESDYEGASVDVDFTFRLNQDSSQYSQ